MEERRGPEGHAFLSYAHVDAARADRLQRLLETSGIRVWRDTSDLWPGEDWRVRIRQAITEDALAFLACFSRASLDREAGYQNAEIALAIEQMQLRRPDVPFLIPVRFDDCAIPDLDLGGHRALGSIHRADLFGDDEDGNSVRLVEAVRRLLGRQPEPAGPREPGGPLSWAGRERPAGELAGGAPAVAQVVLAQVVDGEVPREPPVFVGR